MCSILIHYRFSLMLLSVGNCDPLVRPTPDVGESTTCVVLQVVPAALVVVVGRGGEGIS